MLLPVFNNYFLIYGNKLCTITKVLENHRKPCWIGFWGRSTPNKPLWWNLRKKFLTTKYQGRSCSWNLRWGGLLNKWGSESIDNRIRWKLASKQVNWGVYSGRGIYFRWNQQCVFDNSQKLDSRHFSCYKWADNKKINRLRKARRIIYNYRSHALWKK